MKKSISVVFCTLLLSFSYVIAQTPLEKNIKQILTDPQRGQSYLLGYIQPLTTVFGTVMGSGLFHRASVKSFPHFDIGLTYPYLYLPGKSKTFVYQEQTRETAFGKEKVSPGEIPGTGLSALALPLLQINLGLTEDFELMLRSSLVYTISELGEIRLSGVGIKYGLSDLVNSVSFPIDLSVQASYHLLSMNGWFKTGTFAMNIQTSKEIPSLLLEFYTALGYEVTSTTMLSDKIPGIGEQGIGDVKQNGQNGLRLMLGANLHLLFVTLQAGFEFGYYNVLSLGAKITY